MTSPPADDAYPDFIWQAYEEGLKAGFAGAHNQTSKDAGQVKQEAWAAAIAWRNKSLPQQVAGDEGELDKWVTIHFKEDSIPSLRSGPLTYEDKQRLLAWRAASNKQVELTARIGLVEGLLSIRFKSEIDSRQWLAGQLEQLEAELAALTNKQEEAEEDSAVAEVRRVREVNEAFYRRHGHAWYVVCPADCAGRA